VPTDARTTYCAELSAMDHIGLPLAGFRCMSTTKPGKNQLFLLLILSAIPRIIGAFWLPNAFGDAYTYTEQVYYMRRALLMGTFSQSNLFGFWLPLYQLICAVVSALLGNPFYVPKIISALSGAGVCLLVFLLTLELTANKSLALVSFTLVALNPYHLLYSSAAMTDVPHAFFILLCAHCCIKDRWLLAAVCGLAAGLIRIESWSLVLIIPVLQALRTRRLSVLACITLLLGPAFWLYVSWKAGGSPWRYFEIRNTYIMETLAASPWLATFPPWRVGLDLLRLVYTTQPMVLFACCISLTLAMRKLQLRGLRHRITSECILLVLFFAHLTFLLLAYFTRNQPEIWPRYGLIFFTLGLPVLAAQLVQKRVATGLSFSHSVNDASLRLGNIVLMVLFGLQFCIQLIDVTRTTVKSDPNKIVAEFLEDQHLADRSLKVYCEDGAIRVLSGIPLEEFKDQYNSPNDTESFLRSLRENQIRLLVYKDLPGSRLAEIIREIRSGKAGTGRSGNKGITLEEVTLRPRRKANDGIVLYRVHGNEMASSSR
jgi:hypothetical protein